MTRSKPLRQIQLTRDTPALMRWRAWSGAVGVAEIVWFALLQPRLSAPFHTFVVLALLPLTVVGYVYLLVAVSVVLSERDWEYGFRQTIVLILGSSVGCFVFALMWITREHFAADLS